MAVSGTSIAVTLTGAVLAYSGVKGKKITTTIHSLILGKNPADVTGVDVPIGGVAGAAGQLSGDLISVTPDTLPVISGSTAKANMAIGKTLAIPFGWSTGAQWDALVKLWNQESGWNNHAENPSSGAYGIPQALPPTKMPLTAQKPISDPTSQILWGLTYIRGRYGNPVNAWAHEVSAGWY